MKPFLRTFAVAFWLLALFESLSLLGFEYEAVNLVVFAATVIGTLALLLWRGLGAGLFVLFAELTVGSKGYLFSVTLGEARVSIRLVLFLLVMLAWVVAAIRERRIALRGTPLFWPIVAFFLVVGYGAVRGLLAGNAPSDVFFDGNGYLYAAVAFPLFHAIRDRAKLFNLLAVISAGLVFLAAETLVVLTYFSHEPSVEALRTVYRWIRTTGVGEMTQLTGSYYRIFFQSHAFHLSGFVAGLVLLAHVGWRRLPPVAGRIVKAIVFLSSLVLIVSFSRSFWFALALTLVALFLFLQRAERWGVRRLGKLGLALLGLALVSTLTLTLLVNVPLPGGKGAGVSPASLISERITKSPGEAAATSRLLLLQPLLTTIGRAPILGSGLGTLVTTQTRDPRTRVVNEGLYTTYAFEWGYLDFAIKFGALGTVGLLWFFTAVARMGWRAIAASAGDPLVRAGLLGSQFAFLSLLLTHATTPYLNHPIGLGLTLLTAIVASRLSVDSKPPV